MAVSTLGVGPAERTGNPSSRYCPGGTERAGSERRRPKNLLFINFQPSCQLNDFFLLGR